MTTPDPQPAHLVQMLLPVYDNDHQPFAATLYEQVFHELTHQFGGLTAYQHAPADGAWKEGSAGVQYDQVVIFEVMVRPLERAWWSDYRQELERRFCQEKLLVRALAVEEL